MEGAQESAHIVDELVEDSGFHETSAHPDDHRNRHAAHRLHRREEQGVVADRLVPSIPVIGVHGVEFPHVAVFPGEELNDLHPRDGFLDMRVDPGNANADRTEGLPHLEAEEHGRHREKRDRREGGHRELGIDIEEHRGETQHLEDIGDQGHDARGEHLRHVLHVVGGTSNQAAHRVAVEEAEMQLLDLVEDRGSNVPHGGLTRDRHEDHVSELQPHAQQGDQEVEEGQPGQGGKTQGGIEDPGRQGPHAFAGRTRLERVVEPGLDDPGGGEFRQKDRHHQKEGKTDLPAVGGYITPEQNEQPGIVCLAQGLFFVEDIAHGAPPSPGCPGPSARLASS